jgi:hypothetical protein
MYEINLRPNDLTYLQYRQLQKHWNIIAANPELQRKFYPFIKEHPYPSVLPYSVMKQKPSNAPLLRPWDEWEVYEERLNGYLVIVAKCRSRRLQLPEFLYHHVGIPPQCIGVEGDGYENWGRWVHKDFWKEAEDDWVDEEV